MNKNKQSPAFLRKRKMLMVLPFLVIPFFTMAFWALGGGKGNDAPGVGVQSKGLNLQLPNAHFKEELEDKLSFYEKADKDSLKMAELMRNDPYYKQQLKDGQSNNELETMSEQLASKHDQLITSPYQQKGAGKIEERVLNKIDDLQSELAKADQDKSFSTVNRQTQPQPQQVDGGEFSNQVDRLEQMLEAMNTSSEGDPEMDQVESALDKILDIQHPERVKERLKTQSLQHKDAAFPVTVGDRKRTVGLLDTAHRPDQSSSFFYGVDHPAKHFESQPSIAAIVPETQTLVSGAIIKLRLIDDIYINGTLIPKDNLVFGVAALNNERLQIEVSSIRYKQSLFPVKLAVFDLDGLPGIYIPGAISREVAKQSTDNSLQSIEMTTMDPSLKAQAAAAGIGAAKSLISKKVKLVRVMVKAGYRVLLKAQQ